MRRPQRGDRDGMIVAITTGTKFGSMTVLDAAFVRGNGNKVWHVLCGCGKIETRDAWLIRCAIRDGVASACGSCRMAAGTKRSREYEKYQHIRRWHRDGTLYPDWANYNIANDVLDSLVQEFGLPRSGLAERPYETLRLEEYLCD